MKVNHGLFHAIASLISFASHHESKVQRTILIYRKTTTMNFLKSLLLMFLLTSLSTKYGFCQDEDCAGILVKDVTIKTRSFEESIAFAEQIRRDNYEETRRKISAGVTAVIPPVAAMFDGSYEDFQKKFAAYKSSVQYSRTAKEVESIYISKLTPELADRYIQCRNIGRAGVVAYAKKITPKEVIVNVRFTDPIDGRAGRVDLSSLVVKGATFANGNIGTYFANHPLSSGGRGINLVFNRLPRQSFLFSLNVGQSSDEVVMPYITSDPPEFVTIPIKIFLCSGSDCTGRLPDDEKERGLQIVRWERTFNETRDLGPQVELDDNQAMQVFCKPKNELTVDDFRRNIRNVDFKVINFHQDRDFFDLDNDRKDFFIWSAGGRFSFVNNYKDQASKHLEVELLLTFKTSGCPVR